MFTLSSLDKIAHSPKLPEPRKRRKVLLLHAFVMAATLPFSAWVRTPLDPAALSDPRRILLLRGDRIGDFVMTTGIFSRLRRRFPLARIDVICSAPVVPFANLFRASGAVDNVIAFRTDRFSPRELLTLTRQLRSTRYDLAVDLRGDFRQVLIAFLSGARRRLGLAFGGFDFLLTDALSPPGDEHQVEQTCRIARALDAGDVNDTQLPLPLEATHSAEAWLHREGLPPDVRRVALHVSASCSAKMWPLSRFVEAARRLQKSFGARFVLLGGREDISLADAFAAQIPGSIIAAGKLSIVETAAVLNVCDLMVGNDSGPAHIAAAVGCPVISLFGPAKPSLYRPWGKRVTVIDSPLPCDAKCDFLTCATPERHCMAGISADDVVTAAERWLSHAIH